MKRTSPESGLTTPSIAPLLFPLSQGAALVVLNGDGIILDTTWSTEKFKGGISSLAGSTGIHLGIFMSPNPFFWRAEASPDVAHVAHVVHTPGSRTVPRRTGRFASLQPSPFGEVLFGSSFRWYQVISRYGHLWRNHSKSTQHPNIMPYFPHILNDVYVYRWMLNNSASIFHHHHLTTVWPPWGSRCPPYLGTSTQGDVHSSSVVANFGPFWTKLPS